MMVRVWLIALLLTVVGWSAARAQAPPPTSAEQPETSSAPQRTVSGEWGGWYTYSDGRPAVNFEWHLMDDGGSLSGRSIEPNTFNRAGGSLTADLRGSRSGDRVVLNKRYDGRGGQTHGVRYEGRWRGNTITGTWRLDSLSGEFRLTRIE